MTPMSTLRVFKVMLSVAVVVAYSVAVFWLGTTVERRGINSSLAGQNNVMLHQNSEFNDEFKARQQKNKALLEEILKIVKDCRK